MNEQDSNQGLSFTLDSLQTANIALLKETKSTASGMSNEIKLRCASELEFLRQKKIKKISPECKKIKPLMDRIDELLDKLVQFSRQPGTVENYLWACDTVLAWERRLADLLIVTRTVSLSNPPSNLLPPLSQGDALSEAELQLRVERLAKVVYLYRKKKKELVGDMHELQNQDWRRAEVFLANDILNGTIDFIRRIGRSSYWRLENIWMAEVRELVAYLDWESKGAILFDPHTEMHYQMAWREFRERISSFYPKGSANEFGEAKRYLEEKYISSKGDKYAIDYNKLERSGKGSIIHIKSQKVRIEAGKWDNDRYRTDARNWLDAENYVIKYYENIIPAILDRDRDCARSIVEAFDYSMQGPYRIINTFEMALAIYFLSKEALSDTWIMGE